MTGSPLFPAPVVEGLDSLPPRFLDSAFHATSTGNGLVWTFPAGALAGSYWIVIDLHDRSAEQTTFCLELAEGAKGPRFVMTFSLLPGVAARLRLPLAALDLNAWGLMREGALLKRCCYGDRVSPENVTQMRLAVERMAESPVIWEMTQPEACREEPPKLTEPDLAEGPLVDPLGQSRLRQWPGRTCDEHELVERLRSQSASASAAPWPESFSAWGGWTQKQFAAEGFFRLEKDERRWWLVDPDGFAYWSAAVDCIRPGSPALIEGLENAIEDWPSLRESFAQCIAPCSHEGLKGQTTFDFLRANLIRAFGPTEWRPVWEDTIIGLLRDMGFNGFGNWSAGEVASARQFPYVHPLKTEFAKTPTVFRDFPDVWHANWAQDVQTFAAQLKPLRHDPALIGYFLMNEPKWGFASQTPAEGMLFNSSACPAREELASFLRTRHGSDSALSLAWAMKVTLAEIAGDRIFQSFSRNAREDLAAFSTLMAQKFFGDLSAACREVDPAHLNLGARYYTIPPEWLVDSMGSFDVFSMNAYEERIPAEKLERLHARIGLPIIIGEWHFGALDVGLPMAGICRVSNQTERGKAYRRYLEDAASRPWCVGAHYFQLYDQPFLGRFDGENWNIGLIDACHRVYEEFATAARQSHQVMYTVANGDQTPYAELPAYQSRHFF